MTNQQHPIIPPQNLRDKWLDEAPSTSVYDYLIDSATQWGADQELEACCEWLIGWDTCEGERLASLLHEGRRPKPPSLKEQALKTLNQIPDIQILEYDTIRRALEQLND